ncbi:MAG: ABC transporter ATP-binding protein [Pseudonocardiales bacterium]
MRVAAEGVSVELAGALVVEDAVLRAEPGSVVGLLGPNGSGKTTLLRTMFRAVRPVAGVVRVGGDDVWSMTARQAARRTAVVTQDHGADFEFSVTEVVAMGRVPHKGLFERGGPADDDIVTAVLQRVGVAQLAHRSFSTLSGGERQKVLVARALAQQPAVLVLDEPTNHLDIAAQLELLELVGELGVTVVTALHDLNLAAGNCDHVVVLVQGVVVASGPPADVLTATLIGDVFGVSVHCGSHPLTGRPLLAFASAAATSSPLLRKGC